MVQLRLVASCLLMFALVIRTSAQQGVSAGTGGIAGTVTDSAGKPMSGCIVVADRVPADPVGSPSTTTDAAGAYRLKGLPAGEYLVSVRVWTRTYPIPLTIPVTAGAFEAARAPLAPATMVDADAGHFLQIVGPSNVTSANVHPTMNVTTYAGGATSPAEAKTTTVAGDEIRDVNIVLAQRPTVRVEGVLTGAAGPVARAAVRLYLDRREFEVDHPIFTNLAFTDFDGRFLFMAVAPGPYVVDVDRPTPPIDELRVSATGFPATVMRDASGGSDLHEYLPETTLTVSATDRRDVMLRLQRGARITGTVVIEQPMVLASGQLIPPIYITLGRGDLRHISSPVPAAGRSQFAINDVKPGKYLLHAGALLEGFSVVSATLNGRDVKSTPIDVGWADITGLAITIGRN